AEGAAGATRAAVAAQGRVGGEGRGDEVEAAGVEDRTAQARAPAATSAGAILVAARATLRFPAGQRHVLPPHAGPGIDRAEARAVVAAEGDARLGRVALDGEVVARRDDQGGRPEGERVIGVVAGQRDGLAAAEGRGEGDGVAAAGGVSGIDGGP